MLCSVPLLRSDIVYSRICVLAPRVFVQVDTVARLRRLLSLAVGTSCTTRAAGVVAALVAQALVSTHTRTHALCRLFSYLFDLLFFF